MRNIKLLILFLIALLPFLMVKPVFAGFGISPAEIYNDSLKPGATFEKEIVLSRSDFDENLKVVIETDLGEAESWIKFEPGKDFIFPKGDHRKIIKAIINVPQNAEFKNYKGTLRIKASSTDTTNSGVSIVKGARMEVTLVTTSINIDGLNIKGLNIPDVDFQKPIKLLVNIENNGNTEVAPSKIILEIQDLAKNTIETQEVTKLKKVEPNSTKEITAEFKNNLDSGEYFALIKVYLNDKLLRSDRLVFKIGLAPEGYDPSAPQTSNFISKIISIIKQNKVETIAFILIPLFPLIIGYVLFKKSKSKKFKLIFLTITIIYGIIAFILLSIYHRGRIVNLAKPGDQGNVQGEMIEVKPTDIPKVNPQSNLIINKESPNYPIYRIPDLNSPVVYTAVENEKLSIVEEKEDWYRVLTGEGTGGWLPKTSVKKTE
jgi:Bacterial SH3 domain